MQAQRVLLRIARYGALILAMLVLAVVGRASDSTVSAQFSNHHRIIVGIASTSAYCNMWSGNSPPQMPGWCWHNDERPYFNTSGLDLNLGGSTTGAHVYNQDYGYGGDVHAEIIDLGTSGCTGVHVKYYDHFSGQYLGSEHYLHIVVDGTTAGTSFNMYMGWSFVHLGTIAGSQSNCTWTGPHLHQAGEFRDGPSGNPTAFYTNWCIITPSDIFDGCPSQQFSGMTNQNVVISPTGDYDTKYTHRVIW